MKNAILEKPDVSEEQKKEEDTLPQEKVAEEIEEITKAERKSSTYNKSYDEAEAGLKPDENLDKDSKYLQMAHQKTVEEEGQEAVDYLKKEINKVDQNLKEEGKEFISKESVESEEKESSVSLENVSSKFHIDPGYGLKRIEIENYAENLVKEIRHLDKMSREDGVKANFVIREKIEELENLQKVARKRRLFGGRKRKEILKNLKYKNTSAKNAKSIINRIKSQDAKK